MEDLMEIRRAYESREGRDEFAVAGVRYLEYRDAEEITAWKVLVASDGDVLVDKHDGVGLIRPARTVSDGAYHVVALARAKPTPSDRYYRRRVSRLVCRAFRGPPPTPKHNVVEHKNDQSDDNNLENLVWGTDAANRARRTMNEQDGRSAPGKTRRLPLSRTLLREIKKRTGLRGRRLAEFVESLIRETLECNPAGITGAHK